MFRAVFLSLLLSVLTVNGQESPCESDAAWAWTPWFNSHQPNSKGEYELHAAIRRQHPITVCTEPRAVSAVNQAGIHMNETHDMMVLRSYDVFCLNHYDPKYRQKTCDDYSVRYCCPKSRLLTANSSAEELPAGNRTESTAESNAGKVVQLRCGQIRRPATQQSSAATGFIANLLSGMQSKIINGIEAQPNSWPWVVSIGVRYRGLSGVWQNRTHICGGTLIEPSHVLTAAHCLEQKIDDRFVPLTTTNPTLESFFILRIGIHDIRGTRSEEIYRARRIFIHEGFISSIFENDIAVIRLDRPVPITEKTTPICLPAGGVPAGRHVTVAGWGTVAETSRVHSNVLRQANVTILPAINCRVYRDVRYDATRQLCAAALDWSKDTCAGDSGGPLMYQDNGIWSIGGITSYGYGCSKRGFPGVYTRTVHFLTWIKQKMLS